MNQTKDLAQLKELFDNSYDLVQIFRLDGELIFANQAWKNKLGYDDKDLKKLTLKDVILDESWKTTASRLAEVGVGETIEKFETVFVSKYGKNIFVSGRVYCTKEDDTPEFRGIFYDTTERIRAEKVQSLFYKIANLTTTSYNLDILYASIYLQLNSILKVQNFSVSLKEGNQFKFPYFINEPSVQDHIKEQKELGKFLAQYTFERGKPLMIYEDGIRKIIQGKRLKFDGPLPFIWLGVQLSIEGQPKGVISFHSYKDQPSYNHKDLELLDFISNQMAMAIERKLQEIQIKNQNARIKAIFESSTHEIWSIDKEYNITSFNQNYADTLDSYYDLKIEDQLWGQSSEKHEEKFGKEWADKYDQAFRGKVLNFQTELEDSKGNRIWRDVFINPIQNSDGSVDEVSVIANDITEKKLSELAVSESEEKFRTIFESIQDIYFRCDLEGNLMMISPSVSEMLDYSQEELLKSNISKFYNSDKSQSELFEELNAKKKIKNLEATLTTKNGAELQCLCNVRMIYQKNTPVQVEGVARDISQLRTAYKELESAKDLAEKSLKVKERFLANMSHEIRTPMNGIIGMIDLIASTKLDKEQQDYVKTIKKSSETLLHILNDILDLSKIEAGKMELRRSVVNLEATFEKLYDLFSRQADLNNTSLYYHLADNLPKNIIIDETRLLQVLSNLTSNAIKFSKSRGTIHISVKQNEVKGDTAVIRVQIKDSGIGIAKDDLEKLFTSFMQVDNSSTKSYGGTGLGLAISKELTKSMNGEIGVHSTPGLGSTFWFTFKADIATEEQRPFEVTPGDNLIKEAFENRKPKILVVDDNSVNRKVAGQILKKAGCKVDMADSGMEAIEKAKGNTYDLIFMDIQMPTMDGIRATRQIKRLGLETVPPIIAMTAYSMEEDRERFLNQGLDDYLPKPIQASSIIAKVKDWLKFEPIRIEPVIFDTSDTDEGLIINQKTLSNISKHGGKELLQSVLEDFETETKEQLANCFDALTKGNFEDIRLELHTMKGSAGTLGIEKVARQAESLEAELKKGKPADLNEKLLLLESRFNEFRENLEKIFDDSTLV
ncbi:MAG: PAS domain S-box protein [Cyclobacteriaceae bacterium]